MILAPTLSLSAGSGAAIARPTFSRDFAGEKTLNNGTGPAITFTRASNATFFDANGTLQTAANDTPRFDHSGGSSLGLLIEEARTNSIRNSQAGGSTAGVIGSGGVMPTNWISGAAMATNGLTVELLGSGTEGGLNYIDVKISGTPTGNGDGVFAGEAATVVSGLSGQSWTHSMHVKLAAGSLTNVTSVQCTVQERSAANAVLQTTNAAFTPTSAALPTQRAVATRTLTDASTAHVYGFIRINYASGNPIDLTLRIAAPQLEQGAFATSYIPTTTAAATRAADSAVVTPISSFYNQSEGTLFAEVQRDTLNTNLVTIASLDDNTLNNRVAMGLQGGSGRRMRVTIVTATASQWDEFNAGNSSVWPTRVIVAYKASDFAATVQGGAVVSQASGTVPTATHLYIGNRGGSALLANSHIRRIAYWPRRLSNSLLQQLTT